MALRKRDVARIRKFAFAMPGAWEDHPWGESVAKVGKKVFVFFGCRTDVFSMSVKLPASGRDVLGETFAEPTGYGLGKGGWVTVRFAAADDLPVGPILEWIEESYRAVAPKKLAEKLGEPTANTRPVSR